MQAFSPFKTGKLITPPPHCIIYNMYDGISIIAENRKGANL